MKTSYSSMQKISHRALKRFSSQKFHFEIFPKTNAISITFGPTYIRGQSLKEIDFPTQNAVDLFYRDSLSIGERTLCKGPSKQLQHCFNIHSVLLNAVGRLLNDVERWDEQTVSTIHSTKLSEGPGNLFQAPALFTPETCKGAIMKWQ